jgi:predicted aspartyl protease
MVGRLVFTLVAVMGLFATASHGITKEHPASEGDRGVQARLRDNYQLVVPVSVNGLEPLGFVLDTGTKTTLIDERLGRKLGLPVIARMPLTTFTGTVTVLIHRLDSISMGVASAKSLEVGCVDLHRVYSLDSTVQGVLGQDFLGRFDYLLDYRGRRVVLDRNGSIASTLEGERVPIERRDFRDHVHHGTELEGPRQVHFMLDSGAQFTVVFEGPAHNSGLRIQKEPGGGSFANALGNRSIEVGRLSELRFGDATMNTVPVRLTRGRERERRWESGLLPTSLFRSVYISHSENYVVLNGRLGGR